MSSLDEWGRAFNERVFNAWRDEFRFWESGFRTFYSAIPHPCRVLFLGLNPGGTPDKFEPDRQQYEAGDFRLPDRHDYDADGASYGVAKAMSALLHGLEAVIPASTKLNVVLFRSADWATWKRLEKARRAKMETFSYQMVKEAIDRVDPQAVLVESFTAFKRLRRHILPDVSEPTERRHRGRRILLHSQWRGRPILAIPHPTSGMRPPMREGERNALKTILRETLLTKR